MEDLVFSLIKSQDLLGFINGQTPTPKQEIESLDGKGHISNPDFMSWIKTDRLFKAWLTMTLYTKVLHLIVNLETAVDVWQTFEEKFTQHS